MSIPKVIHYCWFGGNPLPKSAQKCINSWKKYCPDYEIIQWNEENFDFSENRYAREAYEQKKWAFVSDYARLKIIYEYGGIYLDTDVELIKSFDPLLSHDGFMGFQDKTQVASGLGFGACKHHPIIRKMLQDYDDIPFIREDGSLDTTACPRRNTQALLTEGLLLEYPEVQNLHGIYIYPPEYFCPIDYLTGIRRKTKNTYSIHHFDASWQTKEQRRHDFIKRLRAWKSIIQSTLKRFCKLVKLPGF